MRMRARVWPISIGALLFAFLTVAAAVPAASGDNRNDVRPDSHNPGHVPDGGRHQMPTLRQEIAAVTFSTAFTPPYTVR